MVPQLIWAEHSEILFLSGYDPDYGNSYDYDDDYDLRLLPFLLLLLFCFAAVLLLPPLG